MLRRVGIVGRQGGAVFPSSRLAELFGAPAGGAAWSSALSRAQAHEAISVARDAPYAWLFHRRDLMTVNRDGTGGAPSVGGVAGQVLNAGTAGTQTFTAASDAARATVSDGFLSPAGSQAYRTALDLSATDKITVISSWRHTGASTAMFCELTANANSNNGGFFLVSRDTGLTPSLAIRGTAVAGFRATGQTYPLSAVW